MKFHMFSDSNSTKSNKMSYQARNDFREYKFLVEREHNREKRHSSTSSGWGTSGKTAARQEKPSSVKEKRPPPQRMPPPAAAGRGVYVNQKGEQDGFGRGRQFRKARRPLVPDEPTGLDGWIPRVCFGYFKLKNLNF